jgi:ferredoxin/flavodoxin---NADP+ reductase
MKQWKEGEYTIAEVSENREVAEGAFLLKFKRDFTFTAGQVLALGVNPEIAPRLYSIASGEHDPWVEILYSEKRDGTLTPLLSPLVPGDGLMVSEPFGRFVNMDPQGVFVAAGTGIAPFMSLIRSGKAEEATLIHGASYPDYFYYADDLQKRFQGRYIQCCSRDPHSDAYPGRVTGFLHTWPHLDPSKKHYLCGSAEMVVDTRDVLISKGVPFSSIEAEIFF